MQPGDRFEKWTVEVVGHECIVKCECGAVRTVPLHALLLGRSRGCINCVEATEFGEWVVLRTNGDRCLCVCSCGNIEWVNKYSLWRGASTRCVCCAQERQKFRESGFDIREVMLDVESTTVE